MSRFIENLLKWWVFRQTAVIAQCKKPTAQMAHLVFAYTLANAQKPKEPFFSNARQKTAEK